MINERGKAMNKKNLKDYNRLLRAENEALREILHMAADSLSDGCRCGEIKLLQEENVVLVKDLNDLQADWAKSNVVFRAAMREMVQEIDDLQADWAADHAAIIKQHKADCSLLDMTLQEFVRDIEVLTRHRDRFHGIIKELKKEKYDMGMELEKLKKENAELGSQILDYKEIKANLLNEVFSLKEKIRSMEAQ